MYTYDVCVIVSICQSSMFVLGARLDLFTQ